MSLFWAAVFVAVVLVGWRALTWLLTPGEDPWDVMAKAAAEREAEERAEDAVFARVMADESADWESHFTASELAMTERAARRQRLREVAADAARKEKR